MIGRIAVILLIAGIAIPGTSNAANLCEELLSTNLPTARPQLFARVVQGEQAKWSILRSGQTFESTSPPALVLAGAHSDAHAIYAVKAGRYVHPNEVPTDSVELRRDAYRQPCSGRGLFAFFGLGSGPISSSVSVEEYVLYHRYLQQVDRLYRFHLNYQDATGGCASTDDPDNGNIQQFLFGDDSDRVVEKRAALVAALKTLRSTNSSVAAPNIPDPAIDRIFRPYRPYGYLETQIVPSPATGQLCHQVNLPAPASGDRILISLNGLTERDQADRRLPERQWQLTYR